MLQFRSAYKMKTCTKTHFTLLENYFFLVKTCRFVNKMNSNQTILLHCCCIISHTLIISYKETIIRKTFCPPSKEVIMHFCIVNEEKRLRNRLLWSKMQYKATVMRNLYQHGRRGVVVARVKEQAREYYCLWFCFGCLSRKRNDLIFHIAMKTVSFSYVITNRKKFVIQKAFFVSYNC